eukprot:3586873-Rhodomonas_salina.1
MDVMYHRARAMSETDTAYSRRVLPTRVQLLSRSSIAYAPAPSRVCARSVRRGTRSHVSDLR